MLAEQLGIEFFNEKLSDQCMQWLSDTVYAVRRAATENLNELSSRFGDDWARDVVIPRMMNLVTTSNYLHRVTALYGLQLLAGCLSKEIVETSVLPPVMKLATDSVPNVRFTVAKTLQSLYWNRLIGREDLRGEVWGLLQSLADDSDRDVRFYATTALTVQ